MTPKQKWNQLKKEIHNRIDEIDEETPWQDYEPKWWLEMMKVRDSIKTTPKPFDK